MAPEKGKRRTKIPKKASRTASPRSHPYPSGCRYSLSATDTHEACPVCLGILHVKTALESPNSCSHCCQMPAVVRKRHADAFAKAMERAAALKAVGPTELLAPEPELENTDLECNGQVGEENMSDSSVPVEDLTPEVSDQDTEYGCRGESVDSSQNLVQVLPRPDVSVPALSLAAHLAPAATDAKPALPSKACRASEKQLDKCYRTQGFVV